MADKYLIWWTNQNDCERIVPLDTWPLWLYDAFKSREGRAGRGRLWFPKPLEDAPEVPQGVTVEWDENNNWLCKAATDAGGIVVPAYLTKEIQFLPGFITTFAMTLPDAN